MIEFLIKNKEWLFSGLGIALVVLVYRVIRMVVVKMKEQERIEVLNVNPLPKKKDTDPQFNRVKTAESKDMRLKNKSFTRAEENFQREKANSYSSESQFRNQSAELPSANALTPASIMKVINAAPLLQQPQLAENYKGLVISCRGKIVSAYPGIGDDTNLILSCGGVSIPRMRPIEK